MLLFKPNKCFIIAEISANHAQNFKRAVALMKKVKAIGTDAVKFQTYTPETMTIDIKTKPFMIKHPKWGGQSLYDLYKTAHTPWSWFKRLKKIADDMGLMIFSTAFDKTSVDFLEDLNVPVHKIASFELTDLPLIEYIAKTKKPLIISTGMSTVAEIKEALQTARRAGAKEIVLLKCVSKYPADPDEMNFLTIPDMQKKFGVPIGLSDHTLGIGVSVAAVALGACVIEKHIISSRTLKTPDNFFSMEPDEFKLLIENVRLAEMARGKVHYGLTEKEKGNRVFRRSLFIVKDINKGEVLTEDHIRSIRPAYGLAPKYLSKVLGRPVKRSLKRGTPFQLEFV